MVVSPEPSASLRILGGGTTVVQEEENYVNQEVIDETVSGVQGADQEVIKETTSRKQEGDYANQEIFAGVAMSGSQEGDYANQVIIEENCSKESDYSDYDRLRTIRGATPIRSRTLTPERSDYMNQELLDGDIIPLSLAVPSSSVTAPIMRADRVLQGDQSWGEKIPDYANLSDRTGEEEAGKVGKETSLDQRLGSHDASPASAPLLTPQISLPISPASSRRSMSPQNERESALDFRGSSPHSTHGSELVPLRSAPGSGYSSGATTPDALSIDSLDDYYDDKPSDVSQAPSLVIVEDSDGPTQSRGISRAAATVRGSSGRHQEVSDPHPHIHP